MIKPGTHAQSKVKTHHPLLGSYRLQIDKEIFHPFKDNLPRFGKERMASYESSQMRKALDFARNQFAQSNIKLTEIVECSQLIEATCNKHLTQVSFEHSNESMGPANVLALHVIHLANEKRFNGRKLKPDDYFAVLAIAIIQNAIETLNSNIESGVFTRQGYYLDDARPCIAPLDLQLMELMEVVRSFQDKSNEKRNIVKRRYSKRDEFLENQFIPYMLNYFKNTAKPKHIHGINEFIKKLLPKEIRLLSKDANDPLNSLIKYWRKWRNQNKDWNK